jgi:hypothetical protein
MQACARILMMGTVVGASICGFLYALTALSFVISEESNGEINWQTAMTFLLFFAADVTAITIGSLKLHLNTATRYLAYISDISVLWIYYGIANPLVIVVSYQIQYGRGNPICAYSDVSRLILGIFVPFIPIMVGILMRSAYLCYEERCITTRENHERYVELPNPSIRIVEG